MATRVECTDFPGQLMQEYIRFQLNPMNPGCPRACQVKCMYILGILSSNVENIEAKYAWGLILTYDIQGKKTLF